MAASKSAKAVKPSNRTAKAEKTKVSAPVKAKPKPLTTAHKASTLTPANSWLQDVTLEVPVPPQQTFVAGSRELEFSVGMRQQDAEGVIRSELRGRALVHSEGQVLALAEASYVYVARQANLPEDLPQQLYSHLRTHLERILALGGHTPPLPASLDKVA